MANKKEIEQEKNKRHANYFMENVSKKIDIAKSMKFLQSTLGQEFTSKKNPKKAADDIEKQYHEDLERRQEISKKYKEMLVEGKLPSPPDIPVKEELTLIDFVKDNNLNLTGMAFNSAVIEILSTTGVPNLILKINKNESIEITYNEETKLKLNVILRKKDGTREELLGENNANIQVFLKKLQKYITDNEKEQNEKRNITYNWSTAYIEEKDEEKRKELINQIYFDMAESDIYGLGELKTLYQLMYCGYDINCFSSPLFTTQQIDMLLYAYENEPTTETEEFLRNFSQFCTNNFSYQFTNSEFLTLFDAAKNNRLNELINDPNFEATFRLLYYFDKANIDKEPVRINIGDITFIAESTDVGNGTNRVMTNTLYIEHLNRDNEPELEKIYQDINGNESGDISKYINAYNAKHKIHDTVELINLYIREFKKEQKINSAVEPKNIQLNNGAYLEISSISYSKKRGIDEMKYVETGCQVRLIDGNNRKVIYTDNPFVSIASNQLIKNVIEEAGGICKKDMTLKERPKKTTEQFKPSSSPIEDLVLGGVTNTREIACNVLQEKINAVASSKIPQEIVFENGEKLIFEIKNYFEDEMKEKPIVYLLDIDGKVKERFIDVDIDCDPENGVSIIHIENTTELIDYFELSEFGTITNPAIETLIAAKNAPHNVIR